MQLLTTCIINCLGESFSENPPDFPKVRFPFVKLVARDSQLNHTPTVGGNLSEWKNTHGNNSNNKIKQEMV